MGRTSRKDEYVDPYGSGSLLLGKLMPYQLSYARVRRTSRRLTEPSHSARRLRPPCASLALALLAAALTAGIACVDSTQGRAAPAERAGWRRDRVPRARHVDRRLRHRPLPHAERRRRTAGGARGAHRVDRDRERPLDDGRRRGGWARTARRRAPCARDPRRGLVPARARQPRPRSAARACDALLPDAAGRVVRRRRARHRVAPATRTCGSAPRACSTCSAGCGRRRARCPSRRSRTRRARSSGT